LLERELGADGGRVAFFDAREWYERPGAAVAAWRAVLESRPARDGGLVHAVGEVQLGEEDGGRAGWARYESVFNHAFADVPAWVICPYDARSVSEDFLAEVRRTHPIVSGAGRREPSPTHFSSRELGAAVAPLGDLGEPAQPVSPIDPSAVRRRVTRSAFAAGLPRAVTEDLVLAVTELAATAVAAGGGAAIRTWVTGSEWCCELATSGSASRLPELQSDLSLVIGRILCDRLELGAANGGTVVRFVFGSLRDPRRRILGAASELFGRRGFRATGVDAIIAAAGVAKATFYACFPSKDALVLECIRSPEARLFEDVWADVEARTQSPAEQLVDFFDVLGDWVADDAFRGWPVLTASAEFPNDDPVRAELTRRLAEPEATFRAAAAQAGAADPAELAAGLNVLRVGAIAAAVIERSRRPFDAARAAAARLVGDAGA
jgi:AcrR family transcriptional regulator